MLHHGDRKDRRRNTERKTIRDAARLAADYKVISFDVFETLLVRDVGDHAAVFRRMQSCPVVRGILGDRADGFASARVAAEETAKSKASDANDRQFTITDIYAELGRALALSGQEQETLYSRELDVEAEALHVVRPVYDFMCEMRRSEKRVAFSSDMYILPEHLKTLLVLNGIWEEGDAIFVSSDLNAAKWSGRLFDILVERMAVAKSDVLHIGNNRFADVQGAGISGIDSFHFSDGNLNRFERALCEPYEARTGEFGSIMAGASRLCRLNSAAYSGNAHKKAIVEVAAGVVAPILCAFCMWMLEDARRNGTERVYFIARDGEILLRICEILCRRLGYGQELRYLYGNRKTWGISVVDGINRDSLRWVFESSKFLSVRSVLRRVFLDPEALADKLEGLGFGRASRDTNLHPEARRKLFDFLLSDPEVGRMISEVARDHRALLDAYLEQEGLFEGKRCACVDLGWYGSMQSALSRLLPGGAELKWYYLGLKERAGFAPGGPTSGFLFDELNGPRTGAGLPRQIGFILETLCSAPHGTVAEYYRDGSGIGVRLAYDKDRELEEWGFEAYRAAIYEVAEKLPLTELLGEDLAGQTDRLGAAINAFWTSPSAAHAGAWGDFPIGDRVGDAKGVPRLAYPFSLTDILFFLLRGKARTENSSWFFGAFNRSSRVSRVAVKSILKARAALFS